MKRREPVKVLRIVWDYVAYKKGNIRNARIACPSAIKNAL